MTSTFLPTFSTTSSTNLSPTTTTTNDASLSVTAKDTSTLGTGAKIGIAAGIFIAALMAVYVSHRLYTRWRYNSSRAHVLKREMERGMGRPFKTP